MWKLFPKTGCQDPIQFYFILFFLAKSYLVLIFGKYHILSYFFGHFAFNFVILQSFYQHYSTSKHSLKISLALLHLASKNFLAYHAGIHFFTLFTAWCLVKYIDVEGNQLFFWGKKCYCCPFLEESPIFVLFFEVAMSIFLFFFNLSCNLTPCLS